MHPFIWIQDRRYDDFFYLQDFENCVVSKIHPTPLDTWEAAIYEDAKCQTLVGRELFKTEREAKAHLEEYVKKILKNKN